MKFVVKVLSLISLFAILSGNLYSQTDLDTIIVDDDDYLKGFETELPSYSEPARSYRVIAFGYTGTLAMHNFDEINALTKKYFDVPEINAPIYLSGINANFAIQQTSNFNLGFTYSAGSKKTESKLTQPVDYTRYVNYRLSYTGIELNYAIMPFENFAILPGVNFGLSYLNIDAHQGKSKYDFDAGDFTQKGDTNTYNYAFEGSFFYAEPKLSLHYRLSNNFMLKASGGYSFAFSPKWTVNHEHELNGMPDKIKPEGMNFQIGIYLGFFEF